MELIVIQRIFEEAAAAAIIGPAFAMLFGVRPKLLIYIAASSALCRMIRSALFLGFTVEIVSATFIAAAAVSLFYIYQGPALKVPRPVFTVASIISLIPGMDAFKALLSLIALIHESDPALIIEHLSVISHSLMRMLAIMLALCMGIAVMPLFFYRYRYHHL